MLVLVRALGNVFHPARVSAFHSLRLITSKDSVTAEQVDANLALLCRLRMLATCANLLYPRHFVSEEQAVAQDSKAHSKHAHVLY